MGKFPIVGAFNHNGNIITVQPDEENELMLAT
jgi:hypothetical protein